MLSLLRPAAAQDCSSAQQSKGQSGRLGWRRTSMSSTVAPKPATFSASCFQAGSMYAGLITARLIVVAMRSSTSLVRRLGRYGGRVQSASTCVQPSAIAARKGTGSNTAASTSRRPRCSTGPPATCRRARARASGGARTAAPYALLHLLRGVELVPQGRCTCAGTPPPPARFRRKVRPESGASREEERTSGTLADARRQVDRSAASRKFSRITGCSVSRQLATTLSGTGEASTASQSSGLSRTITSSSRKPRSSAGAARARPLAPVSGLSGRLSGCIVWADTPELVSHDRQCPCYCLAKRAAMTDAVWPLTCRTSAIHTKSLTHTL